MKIAQSITSHTKVWEKFLEFIRKKVNSFNVLTKIIIRTFSANLKTKVMVQVTYHSRAFLTTKVKMIMKT